MASAAAAAQFKGLDLGTSRIVLAEPQGERANYTAMLNAFVALPYTKMTEQMLEREGILHRVNGRDIIAYGNRVDEFANIFGGDTRRPMQSGLLNPNEPLSLQMVELAIEQLCGKARRNDKICFSVPSAANGHEADLIYHEQTVAQYLETLGYEVKSVNEGLAVVLAELKDTDFTGIGISFGGGMCNVCIAYLGLPVLSFATIRAGDYIDHSAAAVSGMTPTTVRLHKEKAFKLESALDNNVDHALSVYYFDMIKCVVRELEKALRTTRKLPKLETAIPIVFSGGSAQVEGFQPVLKKAIKDADLPIEISDVRPAKATLNATAKGTLVAAMLNM
jgi:hypothetical protein